MACGCYPLCPNQLVYPELYPSMQYACSISFFTSYRYIIIYLYTYLSLVYANIAVGECLYNTDQQLFKSLSRYCERPWVLRSMQVKVCGTYIGSCCIYTDELHSHACFSLVDACSYVFHRWTSPSLHGPS